MSSVPVDSIVRADSPRPCWILVLVWLASFNALACLAEDPTSEIRGDRKLLESILSTQRAQESSFPTGRMVAEVRWTTTWGDKISKSRALTTVVWSQEQDVAFWEYEFGLCEPQSMDDECPLTQKGRMIERPGEVLRYSGNSASLFRGIKTRPTHSNIPEIQVLPRQLWYREERAYLWSDRYNPDLWSQTEALHEMTIKSQSDGIVEVERTSRQDGMEETTKARVSLNHGANLISVWSDQWSSKDPGRRRTEAEFAWEAVGDGRWWLKSFRETTESTAGQVASTVSRTVEIKEFDPNPRIPSGTFELANLQLPVGCRVQEYAGGRLLRRYTLGGNKAARTARDSLEEMVERVKAAGFAAPQPDR